MKHMSTPATGLFLICICMSIAINAQHPDVSKAQQIEWKINGVTVAVSGSSRTGVTVAGGSCNGDALSSPNGVFVDKDDNMWVADPSNGRILKYAPGSSSGVTFGAEFANAPNFPVNIFVNDRGDVYAADYFAGKVKLLVKNGTEWINVAGQNNELDLVRGVWVDDKGNVYCTQYGFFFNGTFNLDGMVLKYPPNSAAFEIVAGHNGIGSGLNQFSIPTSVMLDKHGNMYIADGSNDHGNQNSRVMKWAPGATEGVIAAGGNGEGEASNQCPFPMHAFIDQNGHLYVSNATSNKVTRWKADPNKSEIVAGGNGEGNAADQLRFPIGVFVKDKFLYVVDAGNNRVQRFDLTGNNHPKFTKPRHAGNYTVVTTLANGNVLESKSVVEPPVIQAPAQPRTDKTKAMAVPNPAKHIVSVHYYSDNAGQHIIHVTDVSGRIIFSKPVNAVSGMNWISLDLSKYAKGTYVVNLLKPGQNKESLKIIKD